ncbi:uncharacterized protein LOC135224054 [Macrobrachium nipponense]|uniref:uncharacterized protein LOC135224054 n=1 Tax=Macrobrachium nipponense TaxID=159736 RepID=UPI0030C8BC01
MFHRSSVLDYKKPKYRRVIKGVQTPFKHHYNVPYTELSSLLINHLPKLKYVSKDQLNDLLIYLKKGDYKWEEVKKEKEILLLPYREVKHRFNLLDEFGLLHPRLHDVLHIGVFLQTKVALLRTLGMYSEHYDVIDHILYRTEELELPEEILFKIKNTFLDIEELSLAGIHLYILAYYLSQRFKVDVDVVKDMMKIQLLPTWKPLMAYTQICDILIEVLKLEFSFVMDHPAVLNINPENVKKIIRSCSVIGGALITELIREDPKILLIPHQKLSRWGKLFDKYKVTGLKASPEMIRLFQSDVTKELEERFAVLRKMPEFEDQLSALMAQRTRPAVVEPKRRKDLRLPVKRMKQSPSPPPRSSLSPIVSPSANRRSRSPAKKAGRQDAFVPSKRHGQAARRDAREGAQDAFEYAQDAFEDAQQDAFQDASEDAEQEEDVHQDARKDARSDVSPCKEIVKTSKDTLSSKSTLLYEEPSSASSVSDYKVLVRLLRSSFGDKFQPAAPKSPPSQFSSSKSCKTPEFVEMKTSLSTKRAFKKLQDWMERRKEQGKSTFALPPSRLSGKGGIWWFWCQKDLLNYFLKPHAIKKIVDLTYSGQALSSVNAAFYDVKSSRLNSYRLLSREMKTFIAKELGIDENNDQEFAPINELRTSLGIANTRKVLKLLIDYGFSKEQILDCIQILSLEYTPLKSTLDNFPRLPETQPFHEWMKNSQVLHLLAYLVKKDTPTNW